MVATWLATFAWCHGKDFLCEESSRSKTLLAPPDVDV